MPAYNGRFGEIAALAPQYCVDDNMRVELVKQALQMAHKNRMFNGTEAGV